MARESKNTDKPEEGARSYATLVGQLGEGTLNAELSEDLHALVKRLEAHAYDFGKAKGVITLALAVEIDREGVVTVDPDIKVKAPKPARRKGRYWLTPGGNLTPDNPKQTQLPLREVPKAAARDIGQQEENAPRGV